MSGRQFSAGLYAQHTKCCDAVCAGPIPQSWSSTGAFPSLALLAVQRNKLNGTLPEPASWPQINIL